LPFKCDLQRYITDEAAFKKAKEISMLLGQFFQIQDDYLDCYGGAVYRLSPAVTHSLKSPGHNP
jgi:hypothetical protein